MAPVRENSSNYVGRDGVYAKGVSEIDIIRYFLGSRPRGRRPPPATRVTSRYVEHEVVCRVYLVVEEVPLTSDHFKPFGVSVFVPGRHKQLHA